MILRRMELTAKHFNPRPPQGGRLSTNWSCTIRWRISIHAPREGGDRKKSTPTEAKKEFQSTPPARGATTPPMRNSWRHLHFNPRPPRGGRPLSAAKSYVSLYFNPRPPRGGRRLRIRYVLAVYRISIHAPREGGDRALRMGSALVSNFNPRPPRGGRPPRATTPTSST